ncbi:MAG: hypothetical protein AAF399_06995 [Bacteroidota bacterium]
MQSLFRAIRLMICWSLLLSLPALGMAQSVIGTTKLKRFPTEGFDIYPYDYLDQYGYSAFVAHDPAVRISDGEVVYLWHEERSGFRDRSLRKYNVLMELVWETELTLERQEEILHLYYQDTTIFVLVSQYQPFQNQHIVKAYRFGVESGEQYEQDEIWFLGGKDDRYPQFELAPNREEFLLYYFAPQNPNKRVSFFYDFIQRDERAGYRVTGAEQIHFARFNLELEKVQEGIILLGNKKLLTVGCQLDNEGNVYALSFLKPEMLKVFQYHAQSQEQRELELAEFVPILDLRDPYSTHLPAVLGRDERVLIARSKRKKKGKDKGTKGFQIIEFDFQNNRIDTSRNLVTTSTLQVLVEKERKDFGLRPAKRFDDYMIRDILELPDSSIWLVTQKYTFLSSRSRPSSFDYGPTDQQMDELVLYEFTPESKARQALIVPTSQNSQFLAERMGQFYQMNIHPTSGNLQLITREPSGDELKGPDRLYYREVDLNGPTVSERIQLYDGDRREQFYLKAYTEWLNPDIVSFLMIDGEGGTAYGVSVNVVMPPIEEEDDKKKKWWQGVGNR